MQNRYTGDIGDFGKLGLLRLLQLSGLTIGVNWYLVPDEDHNGDGRHVQYLENEVFCQCDKVLWNELKSIVNSGKREVSALQNNIVLNAVFFSDLLDFRGKQKTERTAIREKWHKDALKYLSGVDVVFVDPDNGLVVPSATGTPKENKFIKPDELADYYRQGSSVVYYQHKARLPDSFYLAQHKGLVSSQAFEKASYMGLKFFRTSQRYYFFIIQPFHKAKITEAISKTAVKPWSDCFNTLHF